MDPIAALAPEIQHRIISLLPLPALIALGNCSHSYHNLVFAPDNDEAVFKVRALAIALAPCNKVGAEEKHRSWRGVLKCQMESDVMRKEWRTKETWISPDDCKVWRIKIDQEERTMVSSTSKPEGGLRVYDIDTNEKLFQVEGVRHHAHIETGAGYVVASHTKLQVWRTRTAVPTVVHDPEDGEPPAALKRGELAKHGVLKPDHDYRALRMVGAELAIASGDAVTIFDIPKMQVMKSFSVSMDTVSYIEFDDQYVFLVGDPGTLIYSRSSGRLVVKLSIGADGAGNLQRLSVAAVPVLPFAPSWMGLERTAEVWSGYNAGVEDKGWTEVGIKVNIDNMANLCSAIHYTDSHLVLATRESYMVVLRDYKQALANPETAMNKFILLELGAWITYLATQGPAVAVVAQIPDQADVVMYMDLSRLPELPTRPGLANPSDPSSCNENPAVDVEIYRESFRLIQSYQMTLVYCNALHMTSEGVAFTYPFLSHQILWEESRWEELEGLLGGNDDDRIDVDGSERLENSSEHEDGVEHRDGSMASPREPVGADEDGDVVLSDDDKEEEEEEVEDEGEDQVESPYAKMRRQIQDHVPVYDVADRPRTNQILAVRYLRWRND